MKTCNYCRGSFPDDVITCENCGAKLPYVAPPPPPPPPPVAPHCNHSHNNHSHNNHSHDNTTVVVVNVEDTHTPEPKKQSSCAGCITLFIIFFLFCSLINIITSAFNRAPISSSTSSSNNVVATETVTPSEPSIDSNIEKIMTATGLTENEAEAVFNNLKSVGFTSVSAIEKADLKQNKGVDVYYASCDDVEVMIGIANKITRAIYANEIYLYADPEGVLYQAADRCITVPIYLKFVDLSKELINTRLVSSSKLEYQKTGDWTITRNMDLVTIKAYADSKNKKGITKRNNFVIECSYETQKPSFISINGKTVYGKPDATKKKKN